MTDSVGRNFRPRNAALLEAAPELLYQELVLSGEVAVCDHVYLACVRAESDLSRQGSEEFPYIYDSRIARRAADWIQRMRMTKGRGFAGKPLILAPWQLWLVAQIFGWQCVRPPGSAPVRRYRYAYVEVPRKNGKSELAAALGLYMLLADGEPGAEIAVAASHLNQAKIVSRRACSMARKTPDLLDHYQLRVYDSPANPGEIHEGVTDGALKAVAADRSGSQDGQNVHCAIVDEVHAHRDRSTWEALEFATGARDQPLIFAITTAGDDKTGVAYEQHQLVADIVRGREKMDRYFGLIYTIDDPAAWDRPEEWARANPNLGVSVQAGDLELKFAKARTSKQAKFGAMLKHLNIWLSEAQAWLDPGVIARSERASEWSDYDGKDCHIGFDLSSKKDVTSIAYVFTDPGGGRHIKWRNYLPEAALEEEHNGVRYLAWSEGGHIELMPGAKIDYGRVYEQLLLDCVRYNVRAIGYDLTHAEQLVQRLDGRVGVDLVEIPQTARHLSDPMKELEADLLAGRATWDGNPCAGWMLGNCQAKAQGGARIRPWKSKEERKIDAVVAAILGYKVATMPAPATPVVQHLYTEAEVERMRKQVQH